jgi:hypothetical protein
MFMLVVAALVMGTALPYAELTGKLNSGLEDVMP